MTRNLRHDLKRVVAGVCALMLVSGTVPVKPIAEVINTAIMASAEGSGTTNVYDFTFDEYTGSAEAVDLNTIIKADEDDVKNWIIDNGSAISESNPNYEDLYAFFFYEMYDEEPVICRLIIESSAIGNAESLDNMFNDSSDYQAYVYDTEDEALSDIRAYCDDSHYKVYFAAAAQNTSTEQTAGFVKTTADTIGSDIENNFVPVSEETVDAWIAENYAALQAERAAAGNEARLYIVYAIDTTDGDSYKVKYLKADDNWSSDTNLLGNLEYEMENYNTVVYYSTQSEEQNTPTEQGAGFTQINSVDELNADMPEVSPDDAKAWAKAHIAEIKAADPDFDEHYYFVFKYDGSYWLTTVYSANFNDNGFESDWYGYLTQVKSESIISRVSNALGNGYKVFLWQGESASDSEEQIVGTWTSGGCTLTLFDTGTLTVSKSTDGNGVMANYYDYDTRDWKNELKKITNIVVEEGVTSIGIHAFYKCTNLTSVTLPEGLTTIDSYAFSNCISLTNVDLPEGLTTIGASAFNNCPNLTSVTLPEGLTTIGNSAFERCENLTSITIPSTVTSIRSNAFLKCTSVTHVYCYPNAADLTWGNSSKDFMSGKATQCHVKASQLAAYQTKFSDANVTFVGDLPETIVGTWTSGGCTVTLNSAGTLTVSKSDDGDGVMEDYYGPEMPWGQAPYREQITKVVVENGVTRIGRGCFINLPDMTSVELPAGLESIGADAFWHCDSLTSVDLPAGLITIEERAFNSCGALTSVTMHAGLEIIGQDAFSRCESLESVIIPNGVITIYGRAFSNCTGLTSVELPVGLDSLGDGAFEGCTSLTSVTIPEGLRTITSEVFSNCTSLTSVTLPAGLEAIGYKAFSGCESLESVDMPATLETIDMGAFSNCTSLTSVTLPEWLTTIGEHAFNGCENLTSVDLPAGLETIGKSAFSDCTNLPSVTLPAGLTTIGESAFKNCTSLTSVTLPEGLTSISSDAFEYCENLTSVTIPSTVTSIDADAFSGCTSVTDVYCYPNASDLSWVDGGNDDFKYDKKTKCHVKGSQLAAYQTKFGDSGDSVNVTFVGDLIPVPAASDFTFIAPTDPTYDSTAKTATFIRKNENIGEITVKYYSDAERENVVENPTNAGTYYVAIDVAEGNGYDSVTKLFGDGWQFTIEKASIAPSVSIGNWTYGEDAKTPSTDGNPGEGEVKYTYAPQGAEAGFEEITSKDQINVENIGEAASEEEVKNWLVQNWDSVRNDSDGFIYFVFKIDGGYKICAFGGYSTTSDVSNKFYKEVLSLGSAGDAANIANDVLDHDDPLFFWSSDPFTETVPTNAGNYTVKATVAETANYEGKTARADFTIAKADLSDISVNLDDWTYGAENPPQPQIDGATHGATVSYQYKAVNATDWSNDRPTAPGTYEVRANIAETQNYNGTFVTDTFVITKASITPHVNMDNWVYGQQPSEPQVSDAPAGLDFTFKYRRSDETEYLNGKPGEPGNYVVEAVPNSDNYELTAPASAYFTITKASITPTVSIENWTYGQEAKNPSVDGNTGEGAVTYTYAPKDTNEFTDDVPENAGTYWVKATVSGTNHYFGAVAYKEFTIEKASIEPTVSIENWTYGETAKNPSTDGNPGEGEVTYTYAPKGSDDFTEAVPTNAGNYTVKATVAETANFEGGEATANFTIAKADPTVTAPTAKIDLIYTGEDQALIEGGSTTGGTIQYSLDGVEFSTKIPEATNAGKYTVYYKVIGDENYNSTDVKFVDVTIARADLTVTVTGYEGTFDGNPHGISVDVGNSGAVVYYAKSVINADNYADIGSTESPSFTNAGNYRVYYYVTTGNYDPNPVSGSILVTIKKADAPVLTDDQKPTPVDKLVYTGEALDLVTAPENIPDGYSIRYSINGGAWISTLPTAIESGTYTVAYKYVENTNYKDIAGETFTITVKDKYTEPMWVWADDYSSATATFIKNDNSSEPIILDAEVTSEVVSEPTYTEYGKTVYIATVKLEGKTYTYRKPVITAMLSLTHVEAVPATCDEAGNIEYWFDAENEKYFADDKGENEITKADTIVAPIDHAYGEPQWIWNAENAATATFKCANCGDEQTINAVVTAEVTAPTYTKNGKTVYTATVNFDGKTYTDTLTVTIGKKAYTAPTISYLKGDGAVKLSWNAIEGAERYAIAGFIDGKWKLLNRTEDTSFIIDNLNPGEQYKVAVVAMFDGEYIMDFSNAITVTPKPAQEVVYPKITEIEYNEQYHQFKLNWTEVPNAQNYGIAVYLAGKWKIQTQSIPATTTSFTSPKLKAGQTYKMIVCAKVNGKWDLSALNSRAFSVTVK